MAAAAILLDRAEGARLRLSALVSALAEEAHPAAGHLWHQAVAGVVRQLGVNPEGLADPAGPAQVQD